MQMTWPVWWQGMSKARKRFWGMALLLAVACSWLYLAGHSRYGLFDVDEGVFTQATVEMRHSGEFSMPTYNAEPRYHKPPLIYWAQDLAMALLGEDSLYAARLPSALSALLTIVLLGWGVWKLSGSARWGLMASMVMGLNLSFLVVGRAATADGLLNLFSTALALWTIHLCFPGAAVLEKGDDTLDAATMSVRLRKVAARTHAVRRQWWITGILAALAFLAKGPVAWIPAVLMVGALLAVRRDRRMVWQRLCVTRVALLTLAILLPWMVLLVAQRGFGFFYEFFITHNLNRYAGGLSNTQSDSVLFYVAVLLLGFFPWVLMLPKAVRLLALKGGVRRIRSALNSSDPAKALPVLALVWGAGYIVFFSLSQTKLAHYIVPAYPALAILVGGLLAQMPRVKVGVIASFAGVALGLVLAVVFGLLNPLLEGLRTPVLTGWLGWLQAAFGFEWPVRDVMAIAVLALAVSVDAAPYFIAGILALAVVPAWVLVARAHQGGIPALAGAWAVCLGLIAWGVVPTIWRYTQQPLAELAGVIANAPASTPVIHLGLHKPSVLYLSERPFLKLENPLQLPEYIIKPETLVLTEADKVVPIVTELGIRGGSHVLGQQCKGGYCLLLVARPGLPDGVAQ